MRLSKIALGLGFALAAVTVANTASAAKFTIDYRHELRSEYSENFDRICLIGAFDNGVGFYVDSSFKSGTDRPNQENSEYKDGQWGDFVANATEMSLWWGYKVAGTGFTITPGIITESVSNQTAYKPYVRLQYNTDFGLWFAVRPRYDYARNDNTKGDFHTYRIDAWVGYNHGNFGINYNYTYMKAASSDKNNGRDPMFDNDWNNYEQNLAMNYRMGQWNPYIEFGDMAVSGKTDDRQLRVRAGIQYTF
ncbi:oligogalacturonate-specific porin KdgM family protein [Anaerobiospirillum succiniciproducens]|uniref:oligogalacturonate-specific porin KdgM family protein n=1 Tax=Anaerobiospirillum succiniciproducens TaxID=13335 RepID=UPI002943B40A|nr:oligogalacturonate-specific porin KdgM family protein [Anaerobiospirillum succiniciproducens]